MSALTAFSKIGSRSRPWQIAPRVGTLAPTPGPVAQSGHVLDKPSIHLEAISYAYAHVEQPVLSGVDFSVGAGEVVALLGPSGCGKSTLIRVLAGLLPLASGRRSVSATREEVEVGLCFQEPRLLPWRTCVENVALPLETTLDSRSKRLTRAKEMLDLVGLGEASERLPQVLSGGMKMRVAVARALVKAPRLLLLDEPFAALDAPSRFELQNLLHHLGQTKQLGVVLVTHSLQEAARLADRACVMASDPGRIVTELVFDQAPVERMDTRDAAFAQALIALQRAMQAAMEVSR